MQKKIIIVGGGPTGLAAAWRLWELGHDNWVLFEAEDGPGGLATSVVDERGFTWDMGGHVAFSHYGYFDRLMEHVLPEAWVEHVREAWVWMRRRFVPYPLQANIWRLPEDDLVTCLEGLIEVARDRTGRQPQDFDEWILQSFGRGLADVFMRPYNMKVWAHRPQEMSVQWMGERVATVDLLSILRSLVYRRDQVSWGPNATFRFPLRGGTGAIWRAMAACLPSQRLCYGHKVVAVDPTRNVVRFADGQDVFYDFLISTMPVDCLLKMLSQPNPLSRQAGDFKYANTHVVGVGLAGQRPEHLATKCWMYFPEPDVPFYRVTVFSNYSPHNVPNSCNQWSLLAEVSESAGKPVDQQAVTGDCVQGMVRANLIGDAADVVDAWHRRLEHGYPVPFLGRDALLDEIQRELCSRNIFSRGRFGAWKYEVGNMDHSVMQGVEVVDHLLFGSQEATLAFPSLVNATKSLGRRFLGPNAIAQSPGGVRSSWAQGHLNGKGM